MKRPFMFILFCVCTCFATAAENPTPDPGRGEFVANAWVTRDGHWLQINLYQHDFTNQAINRIDKHMQLVSKNLEEIRVEHDQFIIQCKEAVADIRRIKDPANRAARAMNLTNDVITVSGQFEDILWTYGDRELATKILVYCEKFQTVALKISDDAHNVTVNLDKEIWAKKMRHEREWSKEVVSKEINELKQRFQLPGSVGKRHPLVDKLIFKKGQRVVEMDLFDEELTKEGLLHMEVDIQAAIEVQNSAIAELAAYNEQAKNQLRLVDEVNRLDLKIKLLDMIKVNLYTQEQLYMYDNRYPGLKTASKSVMLENKSLRRDCIAKAKVVKRRHDQMVEAQRREIKRAADISDF